MSDKCTSSEFLFVVEKDKKDKIIKQPLRVLIKQSLENYFSNLHEIQYANNVYQLILSELEQPLLDVIMRHTRGNQTRAASIMGINRSTLRKKLKRYNMN